MISSMLFLLAVSAVAGKTTAIPLEAPRIDVWQHVVTEANQSSALGIQIAQNFITGVRFNYAVVSAEVLCGNTAAIRVVPTRESTQLNFTLLPQAPKDFVTNCNIPFANGLNMALTISASRRADTFVDVTLRLKPPPASAPKNPSLDEGVVTERIYEAVAECKEKTAEALVQDAANAIVAHRLGSRSVSDNIVLAVQEHVRIGARGFVRFSVENRSRSPWPAGAAKLWFYVPGKEPRLIEVVSAFRAPIVESGTESFAAVSFEMFDLPEDARFVLQIFERNGSRHPRIEGFRL